MHKMISIAIAISITIALTPVRTAAMTTDSLVYIPYGSLNDVSKAWGYTLGLATNEKGTHAAFFQSLIGDEKSTSWKVSVDDTGPEPVIAINQQDLHDAVEWLATPCPTPSHPCTLRPNEVIEVHYGDLDEIVRAFGFSIGAQGPERNVRVSGVSIPRSNISSPSWPLVSRQGPTSGWMIQQRTLRIMLTWFVEHDNSPQK